MTSKFKIVGLFLVLVVVSATTSAATHVLLWQIAQETNPLAGLTVTPQEAVSVLIDCDLGVYSPVQNKCVSQDIFDQEMMRLYSALGIDVSILQLNGGQK